MRRGVTILAISGLVDHQHPVCCWDSGRVLAEQAESFCSYVTFILGRFREKPLQLLRPCLLFSYHRFGIHQSGQGLMPFVGQVQPFQLAAKSFVLVALAQQIIKVLGVGF